MLAHVATAVSTPPSDLPSLVLVAMLLGISGLLAVVLLADQVGLLPRSPVPFGQWTAPVAAGLSWGAAAIHFAVIAEHFAEFAPYGVAFAALAWFQVGWAFAWVVGRRSWLALSAVAVNGGALAVWAASRTVGLPVGPVPGELEPVGALDLLAGALEAGLIGLLAWDLRVRSPRYRPALPAATAAIVVGSVVLAVVVATSAAFAATGTDELHHDAAAEPVASGVVPLDGEPLATDGLAVELPSGPAPEGSTAPPTTREAAGAVPSASSSTPETSLGPALSPAASQDTTLRATTGGSRAPTSAPRPTGRPATPRPTESPRHPGVIEFGSSLDPSGRIMNPGNQFREGETAVWVAELSEAPGVPELLKLIIQVLPDGREFEHWREQVAISDPTATRLAGQAELSLYAHGGSGTYRLEYLRGDELLAAGAFELVP